MKFMHKMLKDRRGERRVEERDHVCALMAQVICGDAGEQSGL